MNKDIFDKCIKKMDEGIKEYGEYTPSSDNRCMYDESIDELLDAINYLAMQIKKIELMKERSIKK